MELIDLRRFSSPNTPRLDRRLDCDGDLGIELAISPIRERPTERLELSIVPDWIVPGAGQCGVRYIDLCSFRTCCKMADGIQMMLQQCPSMCTQHFLVCSVP